MNKVENDAIDLAEVLGVIRRGWVILVAGLVIGVAAALAGVVLLRSEYEGRASVLLRSSSQGGGALGALGGLANMLPLGGLGGSLGSDIETEIEMFTSRLIVGEVVDSLGLRGWIRRPEDLGLRDIFDTAVFEADLRGGTYTFESTGNGYRVSGPDFQGEVPSSGLFELPGARLSLRPGAIPEEFSLEIVDRETAIDLVAENLTVENVAGTYAEILYRDSDPRTAADVSNLLIALYLRDRQQNDRGVSQERFDFLSSQTDSLRIELALAENAFRRHQESSGVLDPEVVGQVGVERVMTMRSELEAIEAESRALRQVMDQVVDGESNARQLAAYPTFLENPAINDLLASLLEFETDRLLLLQTRTERDEEVVALTQSIEHLEGQLATLSLDYLNGLSRQREALQLDLSGYEVELGTLPAAAEESFRRQRDVMRLSETLIVLETQLVQTRLAAMGESGEVRQVDVAVPPKKAAFPDPLLFLATGTFGGLLLGVVGALGRSYAGSRVLDLRQAEIAAGAPAVKYQGGVPLLFPADSALRSVLVLGVGKRSRPDLVASGLATTALSRGDSVAVVRMDTADVSGKRPTLPTGEVASVSLVKPDASVGEAFETEAASPGSPLTVLRLAKSDVWRGALVRSAYHRLEELYPLVVTSIGSLNDPAAAALISQSRTVILTARLGEVRRTELLEVSDALRRLGSPAVGIVLHNGKGDGGRSA